MARDDKVDVELRVTSPNYPEIKRKINALSREFNVKTEVTGPNSVVFNDVNGRHLERFQTRLDLLFAHDRRFSHSVLDTKGRASLL